MTLVSNDPSWWPTINANISNSYFIVASCALVIYDWGLMFGQEKQRWSMMTILYLIAQYVAVGHVVRYSSNSHDRWSLIIYDAVSWVGDILNVMMGVIMIARLYAMYQGSRKVLISLVVIFLVIRIANVVMIAIVTMQTSAVLEEFILSGIYLCMNNFGGDSIFLLSMTWILDTIWEVFALCLTIWIAVKHFSELRRHSARGIIGDCFTVLMQTHISYVASLFSLAVSVNPFSLGVQIYLGFSQIFDMIQLSVLGPCLILSVQEYNAKLVAHSDTATNMTLIAFQKHVHVQSSSI
ncbi:uncharacterized protein EDB93DRAFT_1107620 [Suillus bovinus]|uniref:uncharacterized protein n=1 Tax=Suillus bovinus TaxID=48563 RepID=UPI001B876DAE|nr:uncharacterized protein EDB93DRAFT_1107620 [Suillus bovinus]KAG2133240.1 hypothetical protein EDB93DRAFT_1107620 [Suillus bovinus]